MKSILSLLIALLPLPSFAAPMESYLPVESEHARLHMAVYPSAGPTKGDVLFFHGFSDRFRNHDRLFSLWQAAGLRVLAFDLPGHGDTDSASLDHYNFTDFASLAAAVEAETRENPERPLYLAGWSLGGLIATRIAEAPELAGLLGRQVAGLVLFAPGISVYPCVGRHCFVTNDTLTHDQSLWNRSFTPETPLAFPLFGTALLFNTVQAQSTDLPRGLPTLVMLAGDDTDDYAKTPEVKEWAQQQRNREGARVEILQCPRAFHELDNESPEFGGQQIRNRSTGFLRGLSGSGAGESAADGPCLSL
jgi:alpha-beta hydrolase superfamily lysophospholipase